MSLDGKTVIITGGAGGLGKAITQNFLESGARCFMLDINESLLAPRKPNLAPLTLQEFKNVESIDILVNNAGISDRFVGVAECELEMWQRVSDINLTRPFLMTKFAVAHFKEKNIRGCVINIGSVSSTKGAVAGSSSLFWCALDSYTMDVHTQPSKHGLLGLTKNTAACYGEFGIRCSTVMPAEMATNIFDHFKATGLNEAGYVKSMKAMAVLGPGHETLVSADKVAKMCVYLTRDEADCFNGALISADKDERLPKCDTVGIYQ